MPMIVRYAIIIASSTRHRCDNMRQYGTHLEALPRPK